MAMSVQSPTCHFERSEKSRPSAHGTTFPAATLYRRKEETSRCGTRFLTAFEMTRLGFGCPSPSTYSPDDFPLQLVLFPHRPRKPAPGTGIIMAERGADEAARYGLWLSSVTQGAPGAQPAAQWSVFYLGCQLRHCLIRPLMCVRPHAARLVIAPGTLFK